MSKLTLHIEELVVESFDTTRADDDRGTVHGMDSGPTCDQDTCPNPSCDCSFMDTCVEQPEITCYQSCLGTCVTCPASCYPAQCPSSDGRC